MTAMLFGQVASAHPMPNSLLQLDVHEDSVGAEVSIPVIELALALQWDMSTPPDQLVSEHRDDIARYLIEHTRVSSPDGRPWHVAIGPIEQESADTDRGIYAEITTKIFLTPPAGASARRFSLYYDAVIERVVTHFALVAVRQDWMGGHLAHGETEELQVGVIQVDRVTGEVAKLEVDLGRGSYWNGFASMFQLGVSHIAKGTDHLLFLLTLLLPAPLIARAGRWREYAGLRQSLADIIGIVTAFTLGHSLTLIVASIVRLQVPQAPIEVLIASTILVSAVHAIPPLFAGREALIAGVFGLVHGTAFSFTLAEMDLSGWEMAMSLLGFNLGIEALQLGIITVVMPLLIVIAHWRGYHVLRGAGAATASVAGCGWLIDRMGFANPVAALADTLGTAAPVLFAALAASALAVVISHRSRRTPTA